MKAKDVAIYIIKTFQEAGDTLTNLKLQKLLYYVQGWHLGLYEEPLFEDDIEAWKYGPVVPEVYNWFKEYGNSPVSITDKNVDSWNIDVSARDHVDEVLRIYAPESAWTLSEITHNEQPWLNSIKEKLNIIPIASIKEHFKELAEKDVSSFHYLKNKPFEHHQYDSDSPWEHDLNSFSNVKTDYNEIKKIMGW